MPTHSSTQCPAVAIQFSFKTAPPHLWVLEKPKNEVLRTETCQGHRPKGASLPPTILVSGLGNKGGIPHCAGSLPASVGIATADTVGTDPRRLFLVVGPSVVVVEDVVDGLIVVVVLIVVLVIVIVF